jgi:hypothetical protein
LFCYPVPVASERCVCAALSLSLSQTHIHAHPHGTRTRTHTLSHSLSHSLTLSLLMWYMCEYVRSDIKATVREQKVHNVAKHCNLSERNFVFFSRKTPKQSTQSIEKHMMELASQYYMEEAKRLKKQKDLISKRTQPQLLVRLYFKIGYACVIYETLL